MLLTHNGAFKTFAMFLLLLLAVSSVGGQMRLLSGATYNMGSTSGEADELPVHAVSLSGFGLMTRLVTEEAYDSCVARGHCTPAHYDDGSCKVWAGNKFIATVVPASARNPAYPVVCVTWQQAIAYCKAQRMRLPTEAQWEYAARAGSTTPYPWGTAAPTAAQSVFGRDNQPAVVGSCTPNRWDLFDMLGNAWEWTADYYDPTSYSRAESTDPPGPDVGLYRVIRGGGWYSTPEQLTVSNRHWFSPNFAEVSIGFRCAQ